jgi:hypothetical protein
LLNQDDPILTLDTDWAPDFAIDMAAQMLIDASVKSTWFVTHWSPAIQRLAARADLFELGIHPNFLPNSSHGHNTKEVLRHCYDLLPAGKSMRSHALMQSTPIFQQVAADKKITIDSSIYMPRVEGLRAFKVRLHGHEITRLPIFWEDDLETEQSVPAWRLSQISLSQPGLKIFDFHPIHLVLNTSNLEAYSQIKKVAPQLKNLQEEQVQRHVQPGYGAKSLFTEILSRLASRRSCTLSELGAQL